MRMSDDERPFLRLCRAMLAPAEGTNGRHEKKARWEGTETSRRRKAPRLPTLRSSTC
ncbi:hypothetical protein OUZ56_032658, partial [Daphnia magna]